MAWLLLQGEKDAILADVLRSHTSSSTFDEEVREALLLKLLTAEEVAAQEAEEAAARLEQEAAEADRRQQVCWVFIGCGSVEIWRR